MVLDAGAEDSLPRKRIATRSSLPGGFLRAVREGPLEAQDIPMMEVDVTKDSPDLVERLMR